PGARSVSCAPRAHRGRHSFPTRRSSDLGTANTWADCERLMDKKVDYIGLGPFRFTTTKKTLSPVLGIDAYYSIVDQMKQKANPIPIVAIGGITLSDIAPLRKTGVWG